MTKLVDSTCPVCGKSVREGERVSGVTHWHARKILELPLFHWACYMGWSGRHEFVRRTLDHYALEAAQNPGRALIAERPEFQLWMDRAEEFALAVDPCTALGAEVPRQSWAEWQPSRDWYPLAEERALLGNLLSAVRRQFPTWADAYLSYDWSEKDELGKAVQASQGARKAAAEARELELRDEDEALKRLHDDVSKRGAKCRQCGKVANLWRLISRGSFVPRAHLVCPNCGGSARLDEVILVRPGEK